MKLIDILGQEFWNNVALEELEKVLNQPEPNTNIAKNVILFLGGGLGFQTIMAARIYKGQQSGSSGEEEHLSFEDFPYIGLAKVLIS